MKGHVRFEAWGSLESLGFGTPGLLQGAVVYISRDPQPKREVTAI